MSEIEVPRSLPVDHLSVSSISTFMRCPEMWRRRYIEREYSAPSGAMVLGSAVHAAEAEADHAQMESGARPATTDVQDVFADEWEDRSEREEVDWGKDKPGELKDVGIKVVAAYDAAIAPSVHPVSVEREFKLELPEVDWKFLGYIDLEEADGTIVDRKVRGSKLSQYAADADLQPAPYLLTRKAEGNPAPKFSFHAVVKTKAPYAEVVATTRTDKQLDSFVDRLYKIAAEMHWRLMTENWAYAVPGSWWCGSKTCGYFWSCPGGGMK